MSHDVIIMKFDLKSKAYQAFSEIKSLHADGQIRGEQMVGLERPPNHQLRPKECIDFTGQTIM